MIIHDVEQNTDEWYKLRAGMPTASSAKSLVTPNGEPSKSLSAFAESLASDKYAGQPIDAWEGNKYTMRGHEVEPNARMYYEMMFPERKVTQVGFITDNLMRYGCSPDSFVDDAGLLEIKCLPKRHTSFIRFATKKKQCPDEFIAQVQFQLFVTDREWVDLFFYHELLPKVIVRCYPDKKFFTTLKKQLSACIAERNLILKELEAMG